MESVPVLYINTNKASGKLVFVMYQKKVSNNVRRGVPESTAKVDISRRISVDISISVTLSASAVVSGAGGVGADVLVVGENGGFVGGGVGAEPGLKNDTKK